MKHSPFRILTAAICTILVLPVLIQDGMFMDAMLYTCVSKNLGNGIGTFWEPIFSQTWENSGSTAFHEHPPLAFGIQALFFKIFGNSIYTERIYTFLMMILTIGLMVKIWNLIFTKEKELQKFSWLPILLWISIPVCYWSYQSNMMENTMGVFTLFSVYFALRYYLPPNAPKGEVRYLILCGCFIFFASLTKGVPGIFPLALPGIYWLATRNISFADMLLHTLLLVLMLIGIYGTLLLYGESGASLSFYFEHRLMNRVDNAPTVENRFFTLNRLLQETLIPTILIILVLVFFKIKKIKIDFPTQYSQKTIFFFLLGFAGSLPLMLTLVQRGFYMIHALPFFAIGFAMILAPRLTYLFQKINLSSKGFQFFRLLSFGLLIGGLVFTVSKIGKIEREKEILHDVYEIKKIVPQFSIVSLAPQLIHDSYLQCYLIRNADISTTTKDLNHTFFISEKNKSIDNPQFDKMNLELMKYDLWQKKENPK